MRREHDISQPSIPSPTLWLEFNGNASDSSANNYTPYYLGNYSLSYQNNTALIGAASKGPYYAIDKYTGTEDFSIYFRIYVTENINSVLAMIANAYKNNQEEMYLAYNGGQLWFFNNPQNVGIWPGITPVINDWQEILIFRKNGVLYFYENGVQVYSTPYNYQIIRSGTTGMSVGNAKNQRPNERNFRGYIDEFKYWHNIAII